MPAGSLTLSGSSSNPTLVPPANIVFGGSGSNRTVQITPAVNQTGTANISIVVNDGTGNTATNSFGLTVQAGTPLAGTLTATINGTGTISPDPSGQTFIIGQTYALTAVPGAGQMFTGWTGDRTSSSAQLNFTMPATLVVHANFAPAPVDAAGGTYSGLFYQQDEVQTADAGSFTVSITKGSSYSGKLQLGKNRLSFSGKLNSSGPTTNLIVRKGGTPLTLQLIASGQPDQISGQISDGNWTATLRGDRAVFNVKTNPAPVRRQLHHSDPRAGEQ